MILFIPNVSKEGVYTCNVGSETIKFKLSPVYCLDPHGRMRFPIDPNKVGTIDNYVSEDKQLEMKIGDNWEVFYGNRTVNDPRMTRIFRERIEGGWIERVQFGEEIKPPRFIPLPKPKLQNMPVGRSIKITIGIV